MVQEVTIAELFNILHSAEGSSIDIEKEYLCNGDLEEYEVKNRCKWESICTYDFSGRK